MKFGVSPVVAFDGRMPLYIVDHLVNEGNSTNELASGTSHIEKYKGTAQPTVWTVLDGSFLANRRLLEYSNVVIF